MKSHIVRVRPGFTGAVFCLAVCLLCGAVALSRAAAGNPAAQTDPAPSSVSASSSASPATSGETGEPVSIAVSEEMRGVWVPYMALSVQGEEAFRDRVDEIIETSKQAGMNALFVQVRPFGDALYPSDLYPFSHILTGTQGKDPGYDPMAIFIEKAHGAGMAFYAWVNPLRVKTASTPETLADSNPAVQWQSKSETKRYVVTWDDAMYLNPAYEDVRTYIADGVAEIAARYEVDGIEFDDYFYPTEEAGFDETEYEAYREEAEKSGTALSLLEWRTANINALISLCYQKIKAADPTVTFGISPQGNLSNDTAMGADVATWCSVPGYIDTLCPQLYVNDQNTVLPFSETAETWAELTEDSHVTLYLGLAAYKAGTDADDGTWLQETGILRQQVETGRSLSCDGFCFYSWEQLVSPACSDELSELLTVFS